MWIIRNLFIVIVILFAVGFAATNATERVDIKILGIEKGFTDVPLILVLFEAFGAGILVMFVISVVQYFKMQNRFSDYRRENRRLLEEVKALRNRPLSDAILDGSDDISGFDENDRES